MADNNVLDLLIADHREVQQLVQEALTSSGEEQRERIDAIIGQLVRHSVAEETVVYPVMAAELPNGKDAVEHDTEEHKQLEVVMKKLEDRDAADVPALLAELKEVLDDHVSDEEDEQFPKLREALSEEKLSSMGLAVEALKKVAPTRPHPSAPNNALFHLTVGPGVGLVDRLRDALSGRSS